MVCCSIKGSLRGLGDPVRYPLGRMTFGCNMNDAIELQPCTKCGGVLEILRASNPCLVRCTDCGTEEWSLCDPPIPDDPDGHADGILEIDSFNDRERQAALIIRDATHWSPRDVLAIVNQSRPTIFRAFTDGLHHLVDLRDRLLSIGVSCRILRAQEPHSSSPYAARWSKDGSG